MPTIFQNNLNLSISNQENQENRRKINEFLNHHQDLKEPIEELRKAIIAAVCVKESTLEKEAPKPQTKSSEEKAVNKSLIKISSEIRNDEIKISQKSGTLESKDLRWSDSQIKTEDSKISNSQDFANFAIAELLGLTCEYIFQEPEKPREEEKKKVVTKYFYSDEFQNLAKFFPKEVKRELQKVISAMEDYRAKLEHEDPYKNIFVPKITKVGIPKKDTFREIEEISETISSHLAERLGFCYLHLGHLFSDESPEALKEKAFIALSDAASSENPNAQYSLAKFYDSDKNPDAALILYQKSASQQNPKALYELGKIYLKNPIWFDEANEKFFLSSDKGFYKGMYESGILCYQLSRQSSEQSAQNLELAVYLLKSAANRGYAPAQLQMGNFYSQGIGVAQKPDFGTFFYKHAADAGDFEAKVRLGVCYLKGIGIPKNEDEAFKCFLDTAERSAESKLNIANCYLNGIGTEKNEALAIYYYQDLAVRRRNGDALLSLGKCHLEGNGVEKNPDIALEKFTTLERIAGYAEAKYVATKILSEPSHWVGEKKPSKELIFSLVIKSALAGNGDARLEIINHPKSNSLTIFSNINALVAENGFPDAKLALAKKILSDQSDQLPKDHCLVLKLLAKIIRRDENPKATKEAVELLCNGSLDAEKSLTLLTPGDFINITNSINSNSELRAAFKEPTSTLLADFLKVSVAKTPNYDLKELHKSLQSLSKKDHVFRDKILTTVEKVIKAQTPSSSIKSSSQEALAPNFSQLQLT